jgi:hypothetical protein
MSRRLSLRFAREVCRREVKKREVPGQKKRGEKTKPVSSRYRSWAKSGRLRKSGAIPTI